MRAGYRPEFLAALNLLARACAMLEARGLPLPVLVGGAVVEFDTAGAIHTGDFDLHGGAETELAEALLAVGFKREDRAGWKRGGFYHPELPVGIEMVSGAYFDGGGDRARIRFARMPDGRVPMAATEDLIADRLGQWFGSGGKDAELLEQARVLFLLADALDDHYLDGRIRQDCIGRLTLKDFMDRVRERDHP